MEKCHARSRLDLLKQVRLLCERVLAPWASSTTSLHVDRFTLFGSRCKVDDGIVISEAVAEAHFVFDCVV